MGTANILEAIRHIPVIPLPVSVLRVTNAMQTGSVIMHIRNMIRWADMTHTVQVKQRLNWSLLPTGKVFSVQVKIPGFFILSAGR